MPASFDRTALLGAIYPLDDGFRVRLRMARSSDASPIRGLADRSETVVDDFELARLVQFDPRRRCVICATALLDSLETLVGVGAIALDADGDIEPDTLIVADEHAGVANLLAGALISRASRAAQARVA